MRHFEAEKRVWSSSFTADTKFHGVGNIYNPNSLYTVLDMYVDVQYDVDIFRCCSAFLNP